MNPTDIALERAEVGAFLIMHYTYIDDGRRYSIVVRKTAPDVWIVPKKDGSRRLFSTDTVLDVITNLYAQHYPVWAIS